MVQENLDLIFTIIWSFAFANAIGAALCLFLSPALARLSWVPFGHMAPAILVTIFLGAFQSSQHFGDLFALLGLGVLGWLMKQLGWPRAPFLVGFVLTRPTEQYLWISISRYDFDWLWRPGVIVMGLLLLATVVWVVVGKRGRLAVEEATEGGALGKPASIIFTLAVLIVGAAALYEARSFPYLGAIFPVAASVPVIVMSAAQLVLDLRAPGAPPASAARAHTRLAAGYFVALLVYFALIWLFGFGIATALFTFLLLYGGLGMRWSSALLYTVALGAVAQSMGWLLDLYWPAGVLLGG
jgi:putative tricarboxylic transport membrane protein